MALRKISLGTLAAKSIVFAMFVACTAIGLVRADYGVISKGAWPETWPKELEPLRKQARTLVGPMELNQHFEIPFTKQAEFEAAWPHLLKVKSKRAPIFLVRAPKTNFIQLKPAGVLVHSPPADADPKFQSQDPLPNDRPERSRWPNSTYIELVVDGDIVDLNRIPLPADTPIVDERFTEKDDKPNKSE